MTIDYSLYLERCDPARKMSRFYAFDIEVDLLGTIIAVRRCGRIGTRGRQIALPCASEAAALEALQRLERSKRRRGYR